MKRGIMSSDIFEKIMHEVTLHKEHIKVIVLYHGGEPLLNKEFGNMAQRLKKINPKFFIKTVSNGMALTQERAKELIECGLDAIEFSLDGLSAQESEKVRRKSDVEKIVKNIDYLLRLKKELSSQTPTVSLATTQFFLESYPQENYPSPTAPAWLLELFQAQDIDQFKTTYAMKWPHMGESGMFHELTVSHPAGYIKYCDHAINTLTIRADGLVVPCCYDLTSQMPMGNIMNESLEAIWNGSAYARLRESLLKQTNLPKLCSHCLVFNNPIYLIPKWRTHESN